MSHLNADLWHAIQAYRADFNAARRKIHAAPPMPQLVEEFSLKHAAQSAGSLLYILDNYNPNELSTSHYRIRNCYDPAAVIDRQLSEMAADGLFAHADANENGIIYCVTAKGWQFNERTRQLLRPRWQLPLPPAAEQDLMALHRILSQLSKDTFADSTQMNAWATATRRDYGYKPTSEALLPEMIDTRIFDLWAYRDDAHLAGWRHYHVSPFAWEALTYIWNGQANTPEKLAEVLKDREFSAQEWLNFVDELEQLGWVRVDAVGHCTLTETGKQVREAAEHATDEFFYRPWAKVAPAELDELRALLKRLQALLHAI